MAKIKESRKVGNLHRFQPKTLAWAASELLCHRTITTEQPLALTILLVNASVMHTPGSHSVCAIRTSLGVDQ